MGIVVIIVYIVASLLALLIAFTFCALVIASKPCEPEPAAKLILTLTPVE